MRRKGIQRLTDWRVLLITLLASTLLTGCTGGVALQALDAAVGGAYVAVESWANAVVGEFLASLGQE